MPVDRTGPAAARAAPAPARRWPRRRRPARTSRWWPRRAGRRRASASRSGAARPGRPPRTQPPPEPAEPPGTDRAALGHGLEPQAAQLFRVALPVLGDLHVQVEVDPARRAAPRSAAGRWCRPARSRAPPAPDHDALLAGPLDVARSRGFEQSGRRPAVGTPSPRSTTAMRVRQLVPYAVQRGLADQLGDPDLARARRSARRRGRAAGPRAAARRAGRPAGRPGHPHRRHRHDVGQLGPVAAPSSAPPSSAAADLRAARPGRSWSPRPSPACAGSSASSRAMNRSPGPTFSSAGRQSAMTSTSAQVVPDQVVEPLAEQRARPVQPRGVDEDQLGIGAGDDAAHRVPGRLRLGAR